MKLKNIVLLDKEFLKICVELYKLDLPMRISFPIKNIIPILEKEEKSVEESKNVLIRKFGEVQFNDKKEIIGYDVAKAKREDFESYVKEMNDLANLEFEIPIEKKLEIEINNPDFKDLKLSSEKIFKLESLIEFKM